jgi:hypothetical protein
MSADIALIILAGIGVWCFSLLIWPYGPCRWCKGTGNVWGSNRRRHGDCWFCKGRRRRLRHGARSVARLTGRRGK